MDESHKDFEIFSDPSYFDMWALRPTGVKDFNLTLHFSTRSEAIVTSHVIAEWMTKT